MKGSANWGRPSAISQAGVVGADMVGERCRCDGKRKNWVFGRKLLRKDDVLPARGSVQGRVGPMRGEYCIGDGWGLDL